MTAEIETLEFVIVGRSGGAAPKWTPSPCVDMNCYTMCHRCPIEEPIEEDN